MSSYPPRHPSSGEGSSGGAKNKGGEGRPGGSCKERGRSSRSNNPSSRADNHHGFAATSQNLRPVTHDKVGYPLLCYLNNMDWAAVFPEFTIDDLGDQDWKKADLLLQTTYETWIAKAKKEKENLNEKKWTEEIATGMVDVLPPASSDGGGSIARVEAEHKVKSKRPDMSGLIDVLALGADDAPVLMVEAGLLNADWWKKLDQGLMYAPGVPNFTQPYLFVVLTVDVVTDDQSKIERGRMGVFLITPRDDFDDENAHYLERFRMSLLHRVETKGLMELSHGFGRVIRAAHLLPGWNATDSSYRYLGPSCCRVTFPEGRHRVLRVYDNRFMYTDRRPDLYLDEYLGEGGVEVCFVSDTPTPSEALPFGARADDGSSATRGWLWLCKGQFQAILVPFYAGRHYAANMKDFVPVLKYLKRLHLHGCVHGDVRGFNMAMVDEYEGRLIDLDYGGRIRSDDGTDDKRRRDNFPNYPEGYNFTPPDGYRKKRKARSPITTYDDLYAMAHFMSRTFRADIDSPGITLDWLKTQEELLRHVKQAEACDADSVLILNDALRQFAGQARLNVVPDVAMMEALQTFGYDLNRPDAAVERGGTATFPATGSPSKPQKA